MPDFDRPKIPLIYTEVTGWWRNNGEIQYIAHAVTAAPAAFALADSLEIGAGGRPSQHPDQKFWIEGMVAAAGGNPSPITRAITAAGGAAAITRVEIDCTLMPCGGQYGGCLFQVPALIRHAGLANMPLRIFSHRDENLGRAGANKRYFDCNSSDSPNILIANFGNHKGWRWAPWNGAYS